MNAQVLKNLQRLFAELRQRGLGAFLETKQCSLTMHSYGYAQDWDHTLLTTSNLAQGQARRSTLEEVLFKVIVRDYQDQLTKTERFMVVIVCDLFKWQQRPLDTRSVLDALRDLGMNRMILLGLEHELKDIERQKVSGDLKLSSDTLPQHPAPAHGVTELGKKVFLVHGHDEFALGALQSMLRNDLGLEPLIIRDLVTHGIETIFQTIEREAADCHAVVVLMTPDDVVLVPPYDREAKMKRLEKVNHARQNVIMELGFFLGLWHETERRRIIILCSNDVVMPSDLDGVRHLRYQVTPTDLFLKIRKQFESWGYNFAH